MKPALIIVEGAQGAGKTTLTDYLRNSMPYTNLYRLSGHSDSTKAGKNKSKAMFDSVMQHIKDLENQNLNLVFDRMFFSEEVYTRLGYKTYGFTDLYEIYLKQLNEFDFDIFFVVLYLENVEEFEKRLNREGKAKIDYAKFDVKNSINQQNTYLQLANEIKEKGYDNIRVVKLSTDNEEQSIKIVHELFEGRFK